MSFFMRSCLGIIPALGALLLLTAPVHASKTPKQILEPCFASEKTSEACVAAGVMTGSFFHYKARCDLWKAGAITQEAWADEKIPMFGLLIDADDEKVMWNEGMKSALKQYPDCPIKPLP